MKPSNHIAPGRLKYRVGDATIPEAAGMRYIIHVCNDKNQWGAGFVISVSKRWPKAEQEYRGWYRSQNNFKLGEIQIVTVQSDTAIVNMIAQEGVGPDKYGKPPIRYDALKSCLDKIGEHVSNEGGSIHGPRFGSGLAGGNFDLIEPMITDLLIKRGINVTIYDLPETK